MATEDKNGWVGTENPGKLDTSMWAAGKKQPEKHEKDPSTDKNGWTGTKKPGKLNTSLWNAPKKDSDTNKKAPPKMNIYNEQSTHVSVPSNNSSTLTPTTLTPSADMIAIQGPCQQSGCKCSLYIESTSKWSKGKCKSCNHVSKNHKTDYVRKDSIKAKRISMNSNASPRPLTPDSAGDTRKSELLKKSVKKVKKECRGRGLSLEGGKMDCINRILVDDGSSMEIVSENKATETENKYSEWMKENELNFNPEFNETLKASVSENFELNEGSIIHGKYILHYLKKRIGLDFGECTGGHRWALQFVMCTLFGLKVMSEYGYCVQLKESGGGNEEEQS